MTSGDASGKLCALLSPMCLFKRHIVATAEMWWAELAGVAAAGKKNLVCIWFCGRWWVQPHCLLCDSVNRCCSTKKKSMENLLLSSCRYRFVLFSDGVSNFFFLQGSGQSAGDGPQQHLQEGEASGGEAGRAVPDSARDCQWGGQRSQAGSQGVPVPVQVPPVELY